MLALLTAFLLVIPMLLSSAWNVYGHNEQPEEHIHSLSEEEANESFDGQEEVNTVVSTGEESFNQSEADGTEDGRDGSDKAWELEVTVDDWQLSESDEGYPEELSDDEGLVIKHLSFAITSTSGSVPKVGDVATGSAWIDNYWVENFISYFNVNNFNGDLTGGYILGPMLCLDPTAAQPSYVTGEYHATVTAVDLSLGFVDYWVVVTPPGATTGVVDGNGNLIGYQRIGGTVRVSREFAGSLELVKTSRNSSITTGNPLYSLAGAEYGLYDLNNNLIRRMVTNGQGTVRVDNIAIGEYYVREITPPTGYALDENRYSVSISSGATTRVNVSDAPMHNPISLILEKVDSETGSNVPQGAATLEGAEFTIRYYNGFYTGNPISQGISPTRTWVLRTDNEGRAYLNATYKVSGDNFYYTLAGSTTLPLGTVTIEETKAPEGYTLNTGVITRQIRGQGTGEIIRTFSKQEISQDIVRGDVQIVKFVGSDDYIQRPLMDISFTFTSHTTGEEFTIVTDENGFAHTNQLEISDRGNLMYDTYTVTESSPYPEYGIIPPFEVTISYEGQTLYYIIKNDLIETPVVVEKVDSESGRIIRLKNTTFKLLDENKNEISMIVSYYPSKQTLNLFKTDETGTFMFPEQLSAGTYYLREVDAPYGYLLGEDLQFTVDAEGQWDNPLVIQYGNSPAKGVIEIRKADERTGESLAGAIFEIRALEDIITGDGILQVAKDEVVDVITTDARGMARSVELTIGKYVILEIQAPAGYLTSDKHYEIEVRYINQLTSVSINSITITNSPEETEPEPTQPVVPEEPEEIAPQTGDNIKVKLQWIALLMSFGIVLIAVRFSF